MKAEARRATLARLSAQGVLIPVAVEGIAQAPLFIRAADAPLLDAAASADGADPAAAFIGPLDNLIWDRDLIRWLFDFDYTWEVYKPAAQRKYGHYVLPVLYGDRFIARVEPIFDRKARVLTIVNWWWEAGVEPDDAMVAALAECLAAFGRYLGAGEIRLGSCDCRGLGVGTDSCTIIVIVINRVRARSTDCRCNALFIWTGPKYNRG